MSGFRSETDRRVGDHLQTLVSRGKGDRWIAVALLVVTFLILALTCVSVALEIILVRR